MDVSTAFNADFHITYSDDKAWILHAESHHLYETVIDTSCSADGDGISVISLPIEARQEIEAVRSSSQISSLNRDRLVHSSPLDGANLALNVNLTSVCNLGCTYCFAEGGDYGRIKGKLNKTSDVDQVLSFIRENTHRGEEVRFEFFGGEPMINFEAIEAICERSVSLREELGLKFHYRISTNLTTRLTDAELALFERFAFTLSVSIDGSETTHDRNRPNLGGRGSFKPILENCKRVRDQSEQITLVARMTFVPSPNSSLVDDVKALHGENIFDWFQILPAVVDDKFLKPVFGDAFDGLSRQAIEALCDDKVDTEYKALSAIYGELFQADNRFQGILEIETLIRMILDGEVANGHCSGGRKYFTFSPDKSIMPCHRLVGEPELQSGTFESGVDEATTAAWRLPVSGSSTCANCSIRYLCSGGCKQENMVRSGNLTEPDPRSCRFQFRLVDCAIEAIGRSSQTQIRRDRAVLRDLFVSCGRPTLSTNRSNCKPGTLKLGSLKQLTD